MKVNISQCYNILFGEFQGISRNFKGDVEKAKAKLKENKLRYLIGHVEPLAEDIDKKIASLQAQLKEINDSIVRMEKDKQKHKDDLAYLKKETKRVKMEIKHLTRGIERFRIESETYDLRKAFVKQFIAQHTNNLKLGKLLFGEDFELDNENQIDYEAEFKALNARYKYFDNYSEISKDFEKCYKAALYISIVIEPSNVNEVAERAYKICALFAENKDILAAVDQFLAKHSGNYPNPVHDTFQNNLPVFKDEDGKEKFKLIEWRKNLMPFGLLLIQNLESLHRVEELTSGEIPNTTALFDKLLSKISYKRHEEDPEFADLCRFYRVPEDVFNRALDLIQNGTIKIRDKDELISVVVDLSQLKDFTYLLRLPKNDKRGLILGKITD